MKKPVAPKPQNKKKGAGTAAGNVLAPNLIGNPEAIATAAKEYQAASPYPHMLIDGLCSSKRFLHKVRDELRDNLEFTLKETDLYSLRQSPDLANLESLFGSADPTKVMPFTVRLRNALYSDKFRQLVSDLTGSGPLSAKADMAAAVYTNGSHLLVHDDVIGTRKVSFIIYLTEEEEEKWTSEDGGCLELFAPERNDSTSNAEKRYFQGPELTPTVSLLPKFNRFSMFTVEPGVSFHAVQEVFAPKDRISIQGWYHQDVTTTTPKEDADAAVSIREWKKSIQQEKRKQQQTTGTSSSSENSIGFTRQDVEATTLDDTSTEELTALGMHPMYLDPENMQVLGQQLEKEETIRLAGFLLPPLVAPIGEGLLAMDEEDSLGLLNAEKPPSPSVGASSSSSWKLQGPGQLQRFLQVTEEVACGSIADEKDGIVLKQSGKLKKAKTEGSRKREQEEGPSDVVAELLRCIRDRIFRSVAFAKYLQVLMNIGCSSSCSAPVLQDRESVTARRFRPGLDYTLTSIPDETEALQVTWTFCNEISDEADEEDEEGKEARTEEEVEEEEEEEDEEAKAAAADLWESCEVGGFDCFIKAEDDHTAGAVMSVGDDEKVTNLPLRSNCLNIVRRDRNMMHCVKYLQAQAPSSRLDVESVFRLAKKKA